MSRPERLYGLPGAEVLYRDIHSVWEHEIAPYADGHDERVGPGTEWVIEEFTVRDPLEAMPTPAMVAEWIEEWIVDSGEWVEDPFPAGSPALDYTVQAQARMLLEAMAARVTFHMADELVDTHTLVVPDPHPDEDGIPTLDGRPLYSPGAPNDEL